MKSQRIFMLVTTKCFRNFILSFTLVVALPNIVVAQCPQGAIGVAGAGCGCLAGCNLTAFGGPNCGAGVAGNCGAGYVPMQVDITVPDGCTFTVTAVMQVRPGCAASGADGNCAGCDRLKVDIPGGPKPFQFGPGNASLSDSYTLVGPATIRVSGGADRADEIITYSTTFSGALCVACSSILPIELISFSADVVDDFVEITWITESEVNNDYFTVERSIDGINFDAFAFMDGAGNSSNRMSYKIYDTSPPDKNVFYYRIKQTDFDGNSSYTEMRSVVLKSQRVFYAEHQLLFYLPENADKNYLVEIYGVQGNLVYSGFVPSGFSKIDWEHTGFFLISIPDLAFSQKLIVC